MATEPNESPPMSPGVEKSPSREEILERKKAVEERVNRARAVEDHLEQLPTFRKYQKNGISACLESGRGDQLTLPMKKCIQNLLKVNMEETFGPEWPSQHKVQLQQMVAPEARYIFVKQCSNAFISQNSMNQDAGVEHMHAPEGCLLGFVHYRFLLEEELAVVYVYELHVEPSAQGKGLGKFMLQLIERIACVNQILAVMLTVQKANTKAMAFYTKLGYAVCSTKPSRADPEVGLGKSYEIMCKTFAYEAKVQIRGLSKAELQDLIRAGLQALTQADAELFPCQQHEGPRRLTYYQGGDAEDTN